MNLGKWIFQETLFSVFRSSLEYIHTSSRDTKFQLHTNTLYSVKFTLFSARLLIHKYTYIHSHLFKLSL